MKFPVSLVELCMLGCSEPGEDNVVWRVLMRQARRMWLSNLRLGLMGLGWFVVWGVMNHAFFSWMPVFVSLIESVLLIPALQFRSKIIKCCQAEALLCTRVENMDFAEAFLSYSALCMCSTLLMALPASLVSVWVSSEWKNAETALKLYLMIAFPFMQMVYWVVMIPRPRSVWRILLAVFSAPVLILVVHLHYATGVAAALIYLAALILMIHSAGQLYDHCKESYREELQKRLFP